MPVRYFTSGPHRGVARRGPLAAALAGAFCGPLAILLLSGCHRDGPSAALSASGQQPTLTLQQLMTARIDPAADALWDAVAYIATESGVEDRQPRTQAEWLALRSSALTLLDATGELAAHRHLIVATNRTPGPGELSSAEIERRIAADPAAFGTFARGLERATQGALAAIDARNAQALLDAGGTIDEACEACHVTYWYPDQQRGRP
ncbi:MAG: hypothetical protein JOZ12_13380 [Sinobacteraceae bacterium]|nr:hypothetical protein [Nevskiaceae bacterium]